MTTESKRIRRRPQRAERGTFLLAVLFVVLMMGGLSAAFLETSLADRTSIRHRETSLKALELAEAGVTAAELRVYDAVLANGPDDEFTVRGTLGGGTYEAVATRHPTLPDRWVVLSTGVFQLSQRTIEVGLRRRQAGLWTEGFYARLDLTIGGTIQTDSWDPRLGTTYTQQASNIDPNNGDLYAGTQGHVGSSTRSIDIGGSSNAVRGNAIPGPFPNETTFSGDPNVWGDTYPREEELALPPPDYDQMVAAYAAAAAGGNEAGMTLKDGSTPSNWRQAGYDQTKLDLSPGSGDHIVLTGTDDPDNPTIYFFNNVDLGGQGELEIRGHVRIFVAGVCDLTGGGFVNLDDAGNPASAVHCRIFVHPYYDMRQGAEVKDPELYPPEAWPPEGQTPPWPKPKFSFVKLTGGVDAASAVYAPYVEAHLGGGIDLYGGLVASTIKAAGNVSYHFDEALGFVDEDAMLTVERLYWLDRATPRR